MTTIVTFKVSDGIVMGADSAMTTNKGKLGSNRYDSYHKLNPIGDYPLVTAMWGAGYINGRTVGSLVHEYSRSGRKALGKDQWTVEGVANDLAEFIDQHFQRKDCDTCPGKHLEMLVSGYSSGAYQGEQWHLQFPGGKVQRRQGPDDLALSWDGVTEDIRTLWWGHHPRLHSVLTKHGMDSEKAQEAVRELENETAWGPQRVDFSMPVQDAAELVAFLIQVQATAERFKPTPIRTAPPIDLAVVRYDGVHWISRKSID